MRVGLKHLDCFVDYSGRIRPYDPVLRLPPAFDRLPQLTPVVEGELVITPVGQIQDDGLVFQQE
jgi:hypothetical protein